MLMGKKPTVQNLYKDLVTLMTYTFNKEILKMPHFPKIPWKYSFGSEEQTHWLEFWFEIYKSL